MDMPTNLVAELMEQTLAQQPIRVGMRLKTEESLVAQLGLSRYQLRKVIDVLVEKGILRRTQGSGTYIASIPKYLPDTNNISDADSCCQDGQDVSVSSNAAAASEMIKTMSAGLVIDMETNISTRRLSVPASSRKLQIGLWGDFHSLGSTHQKVIAGMTQRAGALGHLLTVNSIVTKPHHPLSCEALADRIRSSACDGVIIAERWRDLIYEALRSVSEDIPAVFLNSAVRLHNFWPVVSQDFEWAMASALHELFNQGYRRLAILSPTIEDYPLNRFSQLYDEVLNELGITYRRYEKCELGVISAMRATLRLIKEGCPDAIYVTDDFLVEGVAEALTSLGIKPGKDVGIIVLSNAGQRFADNFNWSKVEFDPKILGEMVFDLLIRLIDEGEEHVSGIRLLHRWIPGQTHLKEKSYTKVQAKSNVLKSELIAKS